MSQETEHARNVRIHIDQREYHSPSPTTGSALYRLAQVPTELALFKEVQGDHEDALVRDDDKVIHLKEDEHFHSGKPIGTKIFVNTEPVIWDHREISYDQLVKLAFPSGPTGVNVLYSITWTKPDWQEGTLPPGEKMPVVEGIKFDVRNTDKS